MANAAAAREETDLEDTIALEETGTYFLKVSDSSGRNTDIDTEYTVSFQLEQDQDPNEPNDEPLNATQIGESICGDAWTDWVEFEGTFGTGGDVDWFKLPLSGCDPGLLEAEIVYDTAGLSEDTLRSIQASIAMVRLHAESPAEGPCENDEACRQLNKRCESPWDCAGYGHNCNGGRCAGVGACMAEGQCGALQVQRKYEPGAARDPSDDPPPHAARIIAPIFGDDLLYLRVSDFGGDGFAPDNFYRLRVRTRREPDKHEPSNVYMNTLTRSGQPTGINLSLARRNNVVPVHLCGVRPSDPCLEEQPQCNNGEDDDGDRVTDYPNDPGCTSPTDDREVDPERALPCSNGEDDDFDGLIDYPDDLDCVSAAWRNEGSPACPGGVDLRYIGRQQNLVEGSTGNTALYGGTCGGAAGRESVYALTLSYPGEVTLRLEADFEAAIYALWGCEPGAEEIGCGTGARI